MGQQQLILLVLATVIVGIAIIVGIRAFSENSVKATQDAITQDLMRMANDAQAWKQKPEQFGGQPATRTANTDFQDLANLGVLGYPIDATASTYENQNGCYLLTAATSATSGVSITGWNTEKGVGRTVVVTGVDDTSASIAQSTASAAPAGC